MGSKQLNIIIVSPTNTQACRMFAILQAPNFVGRQGSGERKRIKKREKRKREKGEKRKKEKGVKKKKERKKC